MLLKNRLVKEGNWLFRWRSYLPTAAIPLLLVAIDENAWPLHSHARHDLWDLACLLVSFAGLAVRVLAVAFAPAGTSGRSTKRQSAKTLNTTGLYSTVRNPLYLGNYLIALGVVLTPMAWWLPVIYTLTFWLYYERIIMAEEAFLCERFGDAFTAWAEKTPPFVPRLSQWRPPAESFSLRSVLRREYTGLALIILLHCGAEEFEHWIIERRLVVEPYWTAMLAFGVIAYFTLYGLKRHTILLDAPGR